jgi:D-beta-D-heptose 7-phosphate kinase/D-beta-D-heptose 1-phosphate adenosyltransferase
MINPKEKVLSRKLLSKRCQDLKTNLNRIVFTNGSFDLLHVGHTRYLLEAANKGDVLIVGINSDASVKRYKGEQRPIVPEDERAEMLASLACVDYVTIFDEDEPKELVGELIPDVIVKGSDWSHYVSGGDIVEANGGEVILIDLVEGKSSTNIIQKITSSYKIDWP